MNYCVIRDYWLLGSSSVQGRCAQRLKADDESKSLQSRIRGNSFDKLIIITLASRSNLSDWVEPLLIRRLWLSLKDYCTRHVGTLELDEARWPTTRLNKQGASKNQIVSSHNGALKEALCKN